MTACARCATAESWPDRPMTSRRVADRRERIAQLVGQSGEELVLPAIRLPQQPLGAFALGEIHADADASEHVPFAS
jgi:hypothetical protein